jgi:hypothetical protein
MATKAQTDLSILFPTWFIYNVKFVCGIQRNKITESCEGTGPAPGSGIISQGIYSTEVNIFNYHSRAEARILKYFAPLVLENKAVGFEPKQQPAKLIDRIVLKPNSVTGDDCCGIAKRLKVKNLLNIGFLKIVSSVDLSVTAVYTVADIENRVVSMDVEQIEVKRDAMFQF